MTHLLIVTPMHNEAANVSDLATNLATQTFREFSWVVVDDGSTDDTAALLDALPPAHAPALRYSKANDGGLIGGSAYTSWRFGVERALERPEFADVTHVMKLDADVRLAADYLARVVPEVTGPVGVGGGVIVTSGMREQKFHVPGPVKLYARAAYEATRSMPEAIGFDVMDEVMAASVGLSTHVDTEARFELARAIGASEGRVHGRYRNGRVCRWTGYSFVYFLIHCARYLTRRPYVVGSFAMLWGYATAGSGPYAPELKRRHRAIQWRKLRDASRNPVAWARKAYHV